MTAPLHLHVEAVDTLMFRDGRPFNQHDEGAAEAVSVFPPFPPTLVGAIRLALAKAGGFTGAASSWPTDQVGTGVDWQNGANLGPLRFTSLMVLHGCEPVFPVPLSVVEGKDAGGEQTLTSLRPGEGRRSDLGEAVRLPVAVNKNLAGIKTIEDRWVTRDGMKDILAGRAPKKGDLLMRSEIWQNEPRVGIGIDIDTRRVNEGELYMASHVRPGERTTLYVEVGGGTPGQYPSGLTPLAGEHRMAAISEGPEKELPACPMKLDGDGGTARYTVVHLTPCLLDHLPEPGETLPDPLPGTVVSACLGRAQMIGGWDSVNRRPIAMRPAVPAGSVWFMEAPMDSDPASLHGRHIGRAPEWGFGQIMIGTWS